jgi:hypothetical protein
MAHLIITLPEGLLRPFRSDDYQAQRQALEEDLSREWNIVTR